MPETKPIAVPFGQTFPERVSPAEELARLWDQGARIDIDAFVARVGPLTAADLADVLHIDQHHRWQAGERPALERYLERFPQLAADPDAAVDVIFHEYTIRERLGEHVRSQEYVERFPAYADAVLHQIDFHRMLKAGQNLLEDASPAASTVPNPLHAIPPGLTGDIQIGRAPLGGLSSSREIQILLRKRLRLIAAISFVAFLLYVPVLWTLFTVSWGTALYCAVVVEAAFIATLMSSRIPLSLRVLRSIEACFFAGLLAFFGYQQVQFFQVGFFSALALDSWIGPAIAARSLSWPWAVTIITYGILIPNTARRCVAGVAAMVAAFLAITFGLVVTTPSLPLSAAVGYVLCSMTDMAFAASIAVFGAYRIAILQQAASEMRRLGPYRLIERLGSGGMGEVYLAEHALLRRPCALKLIRGERGGDSYLLSRFEREVQAMATLTHPNTVRVYDYGLAHDGTFYYAMEYLPGLSLQELVTRHGPLPAERAVYLLRQVCGALAEAHAIGLVHRDIKPANVLACRAGGMHDVAKLLDFGLVRDHSLSREGNSLTGVGTIAGTPAFMSPEQAAGVSEVDARSDIYSIGAVAYFLLTGRPPFLEPTSVQTMTAHLTAAVIPPRQHQPHVPADVEVTVLRCLQKDREHRFADVAALEQALNSAQCANAWSSRAAADWWRQADELRAEPVTLPR